MTRRRSNQRRRARVNSSLVTLDNSRAMANGQIIFHQDNLPNRLSNSPPINVPRNVPNQIHWFRCIVDKGGFTSSTGSPTYGAITYQLVDIPPAMLGGLTAIFDTYSLVWVQQDIIPTLTTGLTQAGQLYTAIDYDDNNAPTSINDIIAMGTCQMSVGSVGHTRQLAPRSRTGLYNAAGSLVSAGTDRQWIDCAIDTVQHYCVKYAISAQSTPSPYQIRCTYYMAFRGTR